VPRSELPPIDVLDDYRAGGTFVDNGGYWGATDPGNYGDRVGTSDFEIFKATVDFSGTNNTILTVDIYTNYVNHLNEVGTTYGDLFLNPTWTPNGSDSHHVNDKYDNGTDWGWGLHVGTGGALTLYDLVANNLGAVLSYAPSGYLWRQDQVVLVDTSNSGNTLETTNTASWSVHTNGVDHSDAESGIGYDYLEFMVDLAGTNLLTAIQSSDKLAFHWAMTCANDVIEGSVNYDDLVPPSQVPEPTALSLLGLGLGLMGFRFRPRAHGRA
jgi:hypothetical protein